MIADFLVVLAEAVAVLLLVAGCVLCVFSVFVAKGYNGDPPRRRRAQGNG